MQRFSRPCLNGCRHRPKGLIAALVVHLLKAISKHGGSQLVTDLTRGFGLFRGLPDGQTPPPDRLFLGLKLLLLILFATVSAEAGAPQWIGGSQDRAPSWQFKKSVSIDEAVHSASMKVAADFCTAEVVINGQTVLVVEPYSPTQDIDVMNYVRRGQNEISITTTSVAGPAAVALSITLTGNDGKATTIATDESWQGAVSLGDVPHEQWGIGRRSAAVSAFDNYEQWQQAKGDAPDKQPQFWTVPGFEITRVRNAAADEGSWIALAFDAAGRATISREDTGLLRMTLANDRRSVVRVEPIAADLPECRGLLYLDGRLYANANNAKSMFRLRITDDAHVEGLEKLREFSGGVGHGRNDLALGPDGLIYSIHGDSVEAPGQPILDRTSPLRESRRGPPQQEAYIVRTDRDGKSWEVSPVHRAAQSLRPGLPPQRRLIHIRRRQ